MASRKLNFNFVKRMGMAGAAVTAAYVYEEYVADVVVEATSGPNKTPIGYVVQAAAGWGPLVLAAHLNQQNRALWAVFAGGLLYNRIGNLHRALAEMRAAR